MFFLNREQTNPYFNLAAEEYLLRQGPGDMFMLWQNEPCVVIGKHQNAFAEINYRYCRDEKIPVIRRISGGGAVYHGPGNINFSFIKTVEKENAVDFSRFLKPMMETFARLGLAVTSGKRNDLYIHGLKFSGNAEHVYRDKVLHHGTILFDANLDVLNLALTPSGKIFTDKAVKSVRSKVTNLKPYLPDIETIDEFTTLLIQSAGQSIPELQPFSLSDSDIHNINSLATEKYSTWDWNFG
ncbi:MAG TPA: lipoate--protein ligase family protein, partial [Bacteroidales bacterium]|nr:lipoate--protein ligase family protein [Bacteroidales bacterium]